MVEQVIMRVDVGTLQGCTVARRASEGHYRMTLTRGMIALVPLARASGYRRKCVPAPNASRLGAIDSTLMPREAFVVIVHTGYENLQITIPDFAYKTPKG